MGELGSIFEPEGKGERGPDLRFEVEVPQQSLGDPDGYPAAVPEELMHEGDAVARVVSPNDPSGKIILRLPEGFADGATLRLRGQGGRLADGQPAGDLFLRITIGDFKAARVPRAEGQSSLRLWPVAVVLLAVALVFLLTSN